MVEPDRPLMQKYVRPWHYALVVAGLIGLVACIELAMGRQLLSKSGRILLWVGDIYSPENSQQISDWYLFTHMVHGIVLYAFTRLIGKGRWPVGLCLCLAVFLECTWEVLENSSIIIDRYRNTIAQGYYGDTVLNSVCDVFFAMLGFAVARLLPVWGTVVLVALLELWLAWAIRDNLILNIIMLIHPFEAIKAWQAGG